MNSHMSLEPSSTDDHSHSCADCGVTIFCGQTEQECEAPNGSTPDAICPEHADLEMAHALECEDQPPHSWRDCPSFARPETAESQVYRIEVRFDFTGTEKEARAKASEAANSLNGEVSAIFDTDWEEI